MTPLLNDLTQYHEGLTPAEHLERYGFDLAWVQLDGRELRCDGCRERLPIPNHYHLRLQGLMCEMFVHKHAVCVRAGANRKRAA